MQLISITDKWDSV